jgi:hypothetical protein
MKAVIVIVWSIVRAVLGLAQIFAFNVYRLPEYQTEFVLLLIDGIIGLILVGLVLIGYFDRRKIFLMTGRVLFPFDIAGIGYMLFLYIQHVPENNAQKIVIGLVLLLGLVCWMLMNYQIKRISNVGTYQKSNPLGR